MDKHYTTTIIGEIIVIVKRLSWTDYPPFIYTAAQSNWIQAQRYCLPFHANGQFLYQNATPDEIAVAFDRQGKMLFAARTRQCPEQTPEPAIELAMTTATTPIVFCSISDVERDIGIAKETLRVWERRYGFPQPLRDANGERAYPPEQVHRLSLVKRLLDQGYRPGKIMALGADELSELGAKPGAAVATRGPDDPELRACIALLRAHKVVELRQRLTQSILTMGLQRCVTGLIAPLVGAVGVAWARGDVAVFEEHLFSEMLQGVMRNAIFAAAQQPGHAQATPRVLLTTVPQERHGLGLLMVEALLALEGAHCVSLGVQTPLGDIVEAARAQRADIVALSFSGVTSPRAAVDNVNELRSRLSGRTEVWAGGAGVEMARRHLSPGCVLDLGAIPAAVARWRAQHATLAA
jgi:methanogenic corrinoid protein MtbC1